MTGSLELVARHWFEETATILSGRNMPIQEATEKWTNEIRRHGLRYLVEAAVVGLLIVLPAFSWYYAARIDRLEQRNAALDEDIGVLKSRLAAEEAKNSASSNLTLQCPPVDQSEMKQALERVTLERDDALGLAERLRRQRDQCLNVPVPTAASSSSAPAIQVAEAPTYDCNALQRTIRGLERLERSFEGASSLGVGERSSLVDLAVSHIKELQKAHAQDQVLQASIRALLFSSGSESSAIQTALQQAQGYAHGSCPDLAERPSGNGSVDSSQYESCASLDALNVSLRQLRQNVDASSALTRKDQFVDIFNGLLSQAKRALRGDAFAASIDPAYNHTLHLNTKKSLLQSIDLLGGRVERASAGCRAPDEEETAK